MQHPLATTAATLAWILAAVAAGIAGQFATPSAWALLACVAIVPPVLLLRSWRDLPVLSYSVQPAGR